MKSIQIPLKKIIIVQFILICVLVVMNAMNFLTSMREKNDNFAQNKTTTDIIPFEGTAIFKGFNSPTITQLSQNEIKINTELVIRGENFGIEPGVVLFFTIIGDETQLEVTIDRENWSDDEVKVIVPPLESDRIYHINMHGADKFAPLFSISTNNTLLVLPDYDDYIVEKGDSLYAIAASELGDGNRYNEIIELNKKLYPQLDRDTTLGIGAFLRIPKN